MGTIYLDWLADELRADGVRVVEVDHVSGDVIHEGPAWKRRARSSGGYARPPLCVMWHHTAGRCAGRSQADIARVIADAIYRPAAAPIANVYVWCDGTAYICAGGATNTNGKGRAMTFSRGTVPADSMNSHAVSIELMNDGIGESYPVAQIDAAFLISNAVNRRVGNSPRDLAGHWDYAPTRKIDPARASSVLGPWQPRSVNRNGTWAVDDTRDEAERRSFVPPMPPNPEGGSLDIYLVQDTRGAWWATDTFESKTYVPDVKVGLDGMSVFGWIGFVDSKGNVSPWILAPQWQPYIDSLTTRGTPPKAA